LSSTSFDCQQGIWPQELQVKIAFTSQSTKATAPSRRFASDFPVRAVGVVESNRGPYLARFRPGRFGQRDSVEMWKIGQRA
jgi:hypothetical protein